MPTKRQLEVLRNMRNAPNGRYAGPLKAPTQRMFRRMHNALLVEPRGDDGWVITGAGEDAIDAADKGEQS